MFTALLRMGGSPWAQSSAWVSIFGTAAARLRMSRQIQGYQDARRSVESTLRSEQAALERRVADRTLELRNEVDERRRAEALNRGRNQVLELLARGASLEDTMAALAATVAGQRSNWTAAIHLRDEERLDLVGSAEIPAKLLPHLQTIDVSFSDSPEACAVTSAGPCIIDELAKRHRPWSELLRANGIQSAWSAPILGREGQVSGSITVYARLRNTPTDSDMELLEMACSLALLVLEHRRLHDQLVSHAYHDSLTGLPNRRLGEDRLNLALQRASRHDSRIAVLWLDLNRFKQINDVHGHAAGDQVLETVAERLSGRLRGMDTVARMGGDEFMVILEDLSHPTDAERIAAELADSIAEPIAIEGTQVHVSASFGISTYPLDGVTVDQLERNADDAMYEAKRGSETLRTFSSQMRNTSKEQLELESALRTGLDQNLFELFYQPQWDGQNQLLGFEALLRFHHPTRGCISPSEFVPIAEETQLILPVGRWVLRQACQQAVLWRDTFGARLVMAVNVSPLQFGREDFAESVAQILAETKLEPALLKLELTESVVMKNFTETARQMNRLKRLGVRIAVDDFGTGYSSLSYLHRLPIDILKIDRSFVKRLHEPDGTRPIVEAVLQMAHTLGLTVVAEGVETNEQRSTLLESGCDALQGFLLGHPRPVHQAEAWLSRAAQAAAAS